MNMKVCKTHGYLKEDQIKSGIYKGKKYRKCRECENLRAKKYAERNREKIRAKDNQYWQENKDSITKRRQQPEKLARRREWQKENNERYADYFREKQQHYKETLADPYIKKVIQNGNKNIRMSDIPQSMVELARALMLSKRKVQEKRIMNAMGIINEN